MVLISALQQHRLIMRQQRDVAANTSRDISGGIADLLIFLCYSWVNYLTCSGWGHAAGDTWVSLPRSSWLCQDLSARPCAAWAWLYGCCGRFELRGTVRCVWFRFMDGFNPAGCLRAPLVLGVDVFVPLSPC